MVYYSLVNSTNIIIMIIITTIIIIKAISSTMQHLMHRRWCIGRFPCGYNTHTHTHTHTPRNSRPHTVFNTMRWAWSVSSTMRWGVLQSSVCHRAALCAQSFRPCYTAPDCWGTVLFMVIATVWPLQSLDHRCSADVREEIVVMEARVRRFELPLLASVTHNSISTAGGHEVKLRTLQDLVDWGLHIIISTRTQTYNYPITCWSYLLDFVGAI